MAAQAQAPAPGLAAADDTADAPPPRILVSRRADPDPGQMEANLRHPQACETNDVVRRRIEVLARHLSTARDLLYI